MSTDETKKEDCGCGGQVETKPCSCKKRKIIKVVLVVVTVAALIGVGYWAYTKGYFNTVIEKVKDFTSKKV